MYFFISKVKISLQMDKFPGNDLAEMPIFSHHAYLLLAFELSWMIYGFTLINAWQAAQL